MNESEQKIEKNDEDSLIGSVRENLARERGSEYKPSDFESWNQIIQYLMLSREITLSTAESCTGGYIASQITDLAGSSGYFLGSVVSYANTVKQNVLQVSADTLSSHGAVSARCAEEMLDGIIGLIKSDVGIAVTGIAGPGGGSEEKPVGTVFVSVGHKGRKNTVRLFFDGTRQEVVKYTYHQSMYLLYRFLST